MPGLTSFSPGRQMGFSQRLELRQGQSLVMTPQLLQAIKLLQLSHIDLAAYVETELERNPLLDRAEPDDGPEDGEPWLAQNLDVSRSSLEGDLDTKLDNVFPDETAGPERTAADAGLGPSTWTGVGGAATGGDLPDFEATLTVEASLSEHLAAQLDLATRDPRER